MIRGLLYGAVLTFLLLAAPKDTDAAKVECIKEGELAFHYHVNVHLILINDVAEINVPFAIPANLGLRPDSCALEIHTHDLSGELHIESTMADKTFSIPDLIKYLEEKLQMSMTNHDGSPLLLLVNDQIHMSYWKLTQNLALEDEMKIVILLRIK